MYFSHPSKQVTLPGMSAWTEILCLVHADVSLEKAVKFKWFLEKYTSQGDTVPEGDTLHRVFATPTSSTQREPQDNVG